MAVATGAYIRPNYNANWTPGPNSTLTDPAFAGILDLEIVGGTTTNGRQQSFTFWPAILHAFYNWKAQAGAGPSGGTPMQTSGVRYVLFDDTPTINVTNKYANGSIGILCFASPHSFYVGQFVTIAGVGSSFNGTVKVTAINSTGTGCATAWNITFANTNNAASASSTGTVQAGAAYWNGTGNTPFANIIDTTGLNATNLGPRRWIDFVRALYQEYSATPPAMLITWRTGAVDSTHNMENASSWQQNGTTDEFAPSYILAGNHDAYIQAFAAQIADYIFANQSQVIYIRPDQEMNGNNYSWAYNNQWIEPTNSVAPTATPDNGPSLMNALAQSTASGNPIASSGGSSGSGGYGLYAGMWRHIVSLAKTTITNQLVNNHGMASGAAATLAANVQFVWCVGSGSLITATGSSPIPNPPFPQIPHTYGATGGSSAAAFGVSQVAFDGAHCTLTVAPGTDYVSNSSNSYNLVGHGIPVGASITVSGTNTAADGTWAVTAITNTTIKFASTQSAATISVAGSVTLASVSSYVASCAAWASFYPGDDVVDIVSMDGYNPGSLNSSGGVIWKNFWSGSQNGGNIFSSVYPAVVGFVGSSKPLQISETGCVENPQTNGTPTKANWFSTNLLSGGQLITNMPRVTSLVYFDQGGRNSGYQVRTSAAAFAEWQALGTDAGWSNNGSLPATPPITTGVPATIIVLRNNTASKLAGEISQSVGELAVASDTKQLFLGDGASSVTALPFLPFPPTAPSQAGQVLTSTGATGASWQSAATITSNTATATLGADAALTSGQANAVISVSLGVGTWRVSGQLAVQIATTNGLVDGYFTFSGGAATIVGGAGTIKPATTAAEETLSLDALVTVTTAGTLTLEAYPASTVAGATAKASATAGSGSAGATNIIAFRVA